MHLKQYNELDLALTKAKLTAGQWCRKFHVGNIPWTLALTQAIQQIQYWKGIAKCMLGGKISMTILKWQVAKGKLPFSCAHWALPTLNISQRVKSAYNDYYTIKAQKDHQETWLSQVIEAITSAKDIPKTCLWKQICQNEVAHTRAQQVRQIFSQNHSWSGLLQVNIPDPLLPEQ